MIRTCRSPMPHARPEVALRAKHRPISRVRCATVGLKISPFLQWLPDSPEEPARRLYPDGRTNDDP
jgi:hypothetical protein